MKEYAEIVRSVEHFYVLEDGEDLNVEVRKEGISINDVTIKNADFPKTLHIETRASGLTVPSPT